MIMRACTLSENINHRRVLSKKCYTCLVFMLIHILSTYTYHIYMHRNTVERNAILDVFCKKNLLRKAY